MNRMPAQDKGYQRPMGRWWQSNPYFRRYMAREATAVGVAVYAGLLACGLICLASGEAAWNAWVGFLRSPLSLALHLALLGSMLLHSKSWFEIMPKTMPAAYVGGRRLPGSVITRAGWAAAAVATLAILAAFWWWSP